MDPVTVTGLIASVSQLFEYTGKIVKYVNNVRNAPAERNEITKECVSLLGQLNDLKSRAETTDPNDAWFDGVRKLACGDGPLEQFKESLEKLANTLKPAKGAKKYGKMIVWPLSKQDTQTALSHIHRLQALVAAALTQDHFTLSLAIKEKLDDLSSANTDVKRQQILDWISRITFASKQQDHLRRRQEGTGTWVLNEPLFQGWLLGQPSVLWCPGIPAAGKTILASVIIDHLESQTERRNAHVAFLYCNYKEQTKQTALNLVKSLVRQIIERKSTISRRISNLYDNFIKTQKSPSIDGWTSCLLDEISSSDHIYLVIDAFDECSEANRARSGLLCELRKVIKDPRVRLLITARPMTQAEIDPDRTQTLEIHAKPEYIRLYLENQVDQEERLSRIIRPDPDLRQRIIGTIVSKANGMFLAAELHLASLASKHSLSKVRKSLDTIPEHLDGVYDEAMLRIEQQTKDDAELAVSVLAWISCAQRPLRIIELLQALAVDLDEDMLDPEAMPDVTTLVDICAGLITIDESSDVIRLVHLTTQDYFLRSRATHFPLAHRNITGTCLAYLSIREFQSGCSPSEDLFSIRLNRNPFLAYAATYWATHLHDAEADGSVDDCLREKALDLLTNIPLFRNMYQTEYMQRKGLFISRGPNASVPLHFAISHDLTWIAHELIQRVPDINGLDPHGRPALEIAVHRRNQTIVLGLLQAGTIVGRTNFLGRTVLYNAVWDQPNTTVQMVFQEVRDSEIKSALWHTAVKDAVKDRNLRAIKALMRLADANIGVRRLFHEVLSALVARDLEQQWSLGEIVKCMPQSTHIYRVDTTAFGPLLFGWETESNNMHVLFARATETHVLFSMRLAESFNKAFIDEIAESSVLVLPEDGNTSSCVGLALQTVNLDCESYTGEDMVIRRNVNYHRLLETGPLSSMLKKQCQPFTILHRLPEYPDEIWRIAFSHNGEKLAITGRKGGILIYDTNNYTSPQSLREPSDNIDRGPMPGYAINNISWSPDDLKILATYQNYGARVWDVQKSTTVTVLTGFDFPPTSGDWDPTQASTLIIGSQDSTYGLRSWTESGSVGDEWGESYRTSDLRVSEDGQTLVTITECGLHKYRMETKEKIGELVVDGAKLMSVDITKDSRHILLNNGGTNPCLIIVNSETYEVVRAFHGPSHSQFIIRGAFGGLNDEYVLSGSEDGRVFVWDREARLLAILEHSVSGSVNDVSWHPNDPTIFASGGDDGTLCIWKKSI